MNNPSFRYILGFIFSVTLTLFAYFAVENQLYTNQALFSIVIGLALVQFLVQLYFFLHVGQKPGQRFNLVLLASTVSLILVVVVGSLVIMNNIKYNHMSAQDANTNILHGEGIHP